MKPYYVPVRPGAPIGIHNGTPSCCHTLLISATSDPITAHHKIRPIFLKDHFQRSGIRLHPHRSLHVEAPEKDTFMSVDEPKKTRQVQGVKCPECGALLIFSRSRSPSIDSCGFECYRLECKECGARLAGVIDPSDDKLLLTTLA